MTNTGYQQATIAFKTSKPGGLPLDINGELCSQSGNKQAILLLRGEANPDPDKYEVEGFFNAGDKIDGQGTRRYNVEACPIEVTGFINIEPESIYLDVDTKNINISVSSSHKWSIVTSIPNSIDINKISGEAGNSVINISLTENAQDSDFTLTFVNTVTEDEAVLSISINIEVPNKYPDVWRENIIEDVDEDVCRIGEQVFARRNVQYKGTITDNFIGKIDASRLYNWRMYYPWANIPTNTPTGLDDPALLQVVQEYGDFFGRCYFSLVFIGQIINDYSSVQGDNIYKHQIPHFEDMRELLAFTLCHVWDGVVPVDDNLINQTKGVLGVKGSLGDDPNDNVRFTYPAGWSRDILINGSDKYGLAFSGSGVVHRGNASAPNISDSMFIAGRYLLRPVSSGAPYNIFAAQYRKSQDITTVSDMTYGTMIRDENSAALGSTVRTVRYKELSFEVYTDGNEIRRIKKGDSIPGGFTAIPRGALRGAYFANPTYTLTQLRQIADKVESVTNQWVYSIG